MKNKDYNKIRLNFYQGYSNHPKRVRKKIFKKLVRQKLKRLMRKEIIKNEN